MAPLTCTACGSVAADGARFCASCGTELQRRGDERRVVTVLFADLVGFTSLSETSDPEQVKNLVDRCFERLVADIGAYGGRVDKIIGDAIVALFGAPVAHEDDAERAVRAGLQMQRTLASWRQSAGAAELQMRVGINTGEVLVGALRAGGDYTAMGDVVNTANRLQTAARPGQVLVGPATVTATRHVIRYTPLGSIVAKGREEPIDACVAEEALLPPGARPNRGRAPLVGRDTELALLANAIDAAAARQRAHLLLLVGDAGMGKTRLAEEAAEDAGCRHGALLLEGRCVPYGEANVWWPVAEALRAGCGIEVDDPPAVAHDKCAAAARTALGPDTAGPEVERVTNGLLHLMGYESPLREIDPGRAREEMVRSLFGFVESSCRRRPMVVVLSDLHWADDLVLERMDQLLERVAHLPFVLIGTSRHSLLERWTPKPGRHNAIVFNLDPLDRDAAGELLEALVESDLPDDLKRMLLDRSGGNPFYLEELVALLSEAGVVGAASGPLASELPDTLRGLVAARLDALTPQERRTLADAAVLGRRGTLDALEIMAREAWDDDDISDAISGLVAKDVLSIDDCRWAFRSDVVREVAYSTLTKADRAMRHYGIAKWMEHHEHESAADVDRIAHHYGLAAALALDVGVAEGGLAPMVEGALTWLERALRQAEAGELHLVAMQLSSQALELGPLVPRATRLTFLLARARAAIQLRELDAARDDLAVALSDVEEADDAAGRAQVLLVQGDLEQKNGELLASTASLEAAVAGFQALNDDCGRADALRALGLTFMFANRNEDSEQAFTEALALYRSERDRRGEAWALQNLAWLAFSIGRSDEADEWLDQSAATFIDIGDMGGLGWALGLHAWVRYHQGRFLEAERLAQQVLEEGRERDDRWGSGMMLVLLAALRLWTGRSADALAPATEARQVFEAMGDFYGHAQAMAMLARALVTNGHIEEAFGVLDEHARLASERHEDDPLGNLGLAVTAAQVGLPDRVGSLVATPADLGGDPAHIAYADQHVAFGLLHLQRGDADAALGFLEPVANQLVGNPNAGAAYAMVLVASGSCQDGLQWAATVLDADSATYADRAMALEARGLALAGAGDATAAAATFTEARTLVDGTDDRVQRAMVRSAHAAALRAVADPDAAEVEAEADAAFAAIGLEDSAWPLVFAAAASGSQPQLTRG